MKIKDYLKLIRLKHSVKNLLIFAPLIFSNNINFINIVYATIGFICFSCIAFSIYIVNDLVDYEQDKINKLKIDSPIQKGIITRKKALMISILCFLISIILCLIFFKKKSSILLISYFIVNILYSLKLKEIAYLELMCFVLFYCLRLCFGSVILNLKLSSEIVFFVIFASLYLITSKRLIEKKQKIKKKSLERYSFNKIKNSNYLFLILMIVVYIIWIFKNISFFRIISLFILLVLLLRFRNFKSNELENFLFKDIKNILLITFYLMIILGGDLV